MPCLCDCLGVPSDPTLFFNSHLLSALYIMSSKPIWTSYSPLLPPQGSDPYIVFSPTWKQHVGSCQQQPRPMHPKASSLVRRPHISHTLLLPSPGFTRTPSLAPFPHIAWLAWCFSGQPKGSRLFPQRLACLRTSGYFYGLRLIHVLGWLSLWVSQGPLSGENRCVTQISTEHQNYSYFLKTKEASDKRPSCGDLCLYPRRWQQKILKDWIPEIKTMSFDLNIYIPKVFNVKDSATWIRID